MTPEPWVRIHEQDVLLGAGLMVTRGFVLTALHCLRYASADDAALSIELSDGRRVPGRLCDAIKDADLALLTVEWAHAQGLPPAPPTDWARPRVRWRGPYRPPGETSRLSGWVTHAPIDHQSLAGGTFTAMQLTVDQLLGDYSGYSGSPVEHAEECEQPSVVGMLMEQQLSRQNADDGTNVLYAATVRGIMERFPHFGTEQLLRRARGETLPDRTPTAAHAVPRARREYEQTPAPQARPALVEDASDFLRSLRQWEEAGLISAAEAQEQRRLTIEAVRERILGGGPNHDQQ
ncbi:trypsin-like peptidase domain-containing protein [Streptomyces vilmorinianum]|uniref:trypsin-like peptidase domain-containing protein n=1 Tax=Streptomyces vilmorinianum TaxID=3051092 RepID=UPI0010FADB9C|nr:trypsin-like peptidase domain-containing protein [Streptomyces vilmorinianum]